MRFLPVAERELRVASRHPRTYRARLVGALLAVCLGGYLFWLISRMSGTGAAGRQIFMTLIQIGFVYCLFAGVRATADCLSREKREGTMGLLFLTPLRSIDIVIGKLLANSLDAFYGMVAAIPIFAICLLVGGVQSGEFWRGIIALLNTLFFSMAVGLAVSAGSREERRAVQRASGILVLFGFALPALGEYLRLKTKAVEIGWLLKTLSPTQSVDLSGLTTAGGVGYWWSLAAVHGFSWLALALACLVLPRSWQDVVPKDDLGPWRERWLRRIFRKNQRWHSLRKRFLEVNPVYWLIARSSLMAVETWLLIASVLAATGAAIWFFGNKVPVFAILAIAAILLHTLVKLQICAVACERFAKDKENGTLEVLLATPLSIREILRGHWLGLMRFALWPCLAVVVIEFAMLLGTNRLPQDAVSDRSWFPRLFAAGVITLFIDVMALGWLGAWEALAARNVMQARSRTLVYVLIVPWLLWLTVMSLRAMLPNWPLGTEPSNHLLSWFLIGVVNSIVLSWWARYQLYRHFRWMATQRFQPPRAGWFARLLRSPTD